MKWNDNDAVAVLKCVACGWTFEEILLRGDDVPDCEECAERGEQANTYVRSSRPYGVTDRAPTQAEDQWLRAAIVASGRKVSPGVPVAQAPTKLPGVSVALNMCREANMEARLPTPMCWDLALYVKRLEDALGALGKEADRG